MGDDEERRAWLRIEVRRRPGSLFKGTLHDLLNAPLKAAPPNAPNAPGLPPPPEIATGGGSESGSGSAASADLLHDQNQALPSGAVSDLATPQQRMGSSGGDDAPLAAEAAAGAVEVTSLFADHLAPRSPNPAAEADEDEMVPSPL